ncbi:MAG: hypothetical protein ACTSV7_14570 [Candidatus Baldrarchaeia archaeon]
MSDVVEVKGKKALPFVERVLPRDILEARKLNLTRHRIEEAVKSKLKTLMLTVLDSTGNIDFIPVPELDNLEKFTSILENLPEEDAKAIMYNVPLDTLDELVKLAEDKRPDISTKLLRLMRKYRKSKWVPNPEVW